MISGDVCKASEVPLSREIGVAAIVAPRCWRFDGVDAVEHGEYVVMSFVAHGGAPVPRAGTLVREVIDALVEVKEAYVAVVVGDGGNGDYVSTQGFDDLPSMSLAEFSTRLRRDRVAYAKLRSESSPRCSGLRVNMWDSAPERFRDLLWPDGIPTYRAQ